MSLTHTVRDPISFNLSGKRCAHVRARLEACLSPAKHGASTCWQVALQRSVCVKVRSSSPAPSPAILRLTGSLCAGEAGLSLGGHFFSVQRKGCRHEQAATHHQRLRPAFIFCDLLKGSKRVGRWVFEGVVCCVNQFCIWIQDEMKLKADI